MRYIGIYARIAVLLFLGQSMIIPQVLETGVLKTRVTAFINALPGSGTDEYVPPTASQIDSFQATILHLLSDDPTSAHGTAASYGYRVTVFTDTSFHPDRVHYIIEKQNLSVNYWGIFILSQMPERQNLFIQSPHPLFDYNTGLQGVIIYNTTSARALAIAGAHRCNSLDTSVCAGSTTVCTGDTTAFSRSDQAHNTEDFFYAMTEVLQQQIPQLIVVQNHGFAKGVSDPHLIMSNGTKVTPITDYLSTLKTNLLAIDPTLTFKILHIDTTWSKLTGTTNVQGRLINGSIDPCTKSASTSQGRFLHIEQANTGLRDNETNMQKLADALAGTIPSNPLPVVYGSLHAARIEQGVQISWTTVTEVNSYAFAIEKKHNDKSVWVQVDEVRAGGNSNAPRTYVWVDENPGPLPTMYRLKQIDTDGSYHYSPTMTVTNAPEQISISEPYPNPFNASTVIKLEVSENSLPVKVRIIDLTGSVKEVFYHPSMSKGMYSIPVHFTEYASGIYLISVIAGGYHKVMKAGLVK